MRFRHCNSKLREVYLSLTCKTMYEHKPDAAAVKTKQNNKYVVQDKTI